MSTWDGIAFVFVLLMAVLFAGLVGYEMAKAKIEKDAVKNGMAHWEITNEETGEVEFKWGPKP